MKYAKATSLNGEREPDEIVNERHVERYISPATLDFFRNLGGTEKVTKHPDGTIVVRSVSPEGDKVRVTVFTPVKEET